MENNLHNDGLEDFLRKSFEQYDDSPSDGLWDKIDADLAGEPKVRPFGNWQRWRTWAIAATLVGVIIGQFFFYQKEKVQFTETIKIQADKIERLEKKLTEFEKRNTEILINKNNKSEIELTNNIDLPEQEVDKKLIVNKKIENDNLEKLNSSNSEKVIEENKKIAGINNNTENTTLQKSSVSTPGAKRSKTENQSLVEKRNEINSSFNNSKNTALSLLDLIDAKYLEHPQTSLFLTTTPIVPVVKKSNFSIGVHHSYLASREKISRVAQRPLTGFIRVFNSDRAMTGNTQLTGISAIYKTPKNWLFESGINYRQTSLSMTHLAQLRFRDRRFSGGSTPNYQHDFNYFINTSAGLVDIEVRAEQTDPDETINEDEIIAMEITAEQSINYISIPVLIGYQVGRRKINATIKTGLLANFRTDQKFEISSIRIFNDRFQSSSTRHTEARRWQLKNTTFDFIASTGINYEINRHWNIQFSPILIIPMSNRHNDPYIKSSGISGGIDVGFNYNF